MPRRPSSSPAAMWRDGVHIVDTPVWCDAIRARDVCFVSAADAVTPTRHGQLVGTRETLAMLARKDQRQRAGAELAAPLSRPFTLGAVRLELFSTGHAIGSAGLWVTVGERRVVYAGVVCPRGWSAAALAADARAADTLIIAAPYGRPEYRFPEPAEVAAQVVDHCREVSASAAAVLLVQNPLKGLEVASHLVAEGLPVWSSRPIHHLGRKLAQGGIDIAVGRRASASAARPGQVLVWLAGARGSLPELPAGSQLALVSGEAAVPERLAQAGVGVGFAWSNAADYNDLVEYIDASNAAEVFVTGRHNDELARALDTPARRVMPLGPPVQLSLPLS